MSKEECRLCLQRSFAGVSLVDELERLFIDHDTKTSRSPSQARVTLLPYQERAGETDLSTSLYEFLCRRRYAAPKMTNLKLSKKRTIVSHTKQAQRSQVGTFCR